MTNLADDRIEKSTTITSTLVGRSREQTVDVPHFFYIIPKCVLHGFSYFFIVFLQALILFEISYYTLREGEKSTSASYLLLHLTVFRSNLASVVIESCGFDTLPGGVLNTIVVWGCM